MREAPCRLEGPRLHPPSPRAIGRTLHRHVLRVASFGGPAADEEVLYVGQLQRQAAAVQRGHTRAGDPGPRLY